MGVPSLFRWMARKYPKTISPVKGEEVDNLYLDLNGIIHPCCHPVNKPAPESEEEMFREIFKTIDYLVDLVRPKELLYIAVDGVAPRAKMNQQRERRFKSSKESATHSLSGSEGASAKFDPNTITPGTPFMFRLHESIVRYIESRMAEKRNVWRRIAVVYSGCDVAGEGEHKIYDFIRAVRKNSTRHAICGLDADLIFLSLATHEHSFRVLREDVFWIEEQEHGYCERCKVQGHTTGNCIPVEFPPYIYLDIGVLREYLGTEFEKVVSAGADFERMIDDWIFICFFVGNDFLPSIPSMDIRVQAIEVLTASYLNGLLARHRYLTDSGKIYMPELANLMEELGSRENDLLQAKLKAYVRTAKRRGETPREEDLGTKLFEEAGKKTYYATRLHARTEQEKEAVCLEYVKGLAWVLQYYNKGCPSWDWYYPMHFAPLATDIAQTLHKHLEIEFSFTLTQPKRPLEQIMAVLPPSSSESVPAGLHRIFEECPDNYPATIEIDMFGKTQSWQGVALLPFLDYDKLVCLVRSCVPGISDAEVARNVEGTDILVLPVENPHYPAAEFLYTNFSRAGSAPLESVFYPGVICLNGQSLLPGMEGRLQEEKKTYMSKSISVLFHTRKRDKTKQHQ
ncbi:5'-3' exoribonuclease 4 [Nematocida sp. AWRm77]|nr:5'-3' exoribonuclease 4 [Nematocida sp. AWRm77]